MDRAKARLYALHHSYVFDFYYIISTLNDDTVYNWYLALLGEEMSLFGEIEDALDREEYDKHFN